MPAAATSVALPDDWLAFSRVRSATDPRIEYLGADQLADLPITGDPTKYGIEGRTLIYGQAPTADLNLTIRYYANPGQLAATPEGTWLLVKSPSTYLYAALLEAAIWTKKTVAIGEYGSLLDKNIDGMNNAGKAAQISGGRLRMTGRV